MADYAFIHIPKNAGTSFQKALLNVPEIDFFGHAVNKHRIEYHKKIYVVRNPIDRFTSGFFYLKQYKRNRENNFFQTPEELLSALKDLDVRALEFMKVHEGHHHIYGEKIPTDWAFSKQSKWVWEPWRILKYDNLEEEIKILSEMLGINITIPHVNRSSKKEFTYSDDNIELLKVLYKEDFELYSEL